VVSTIREATIWICDPCPCPRPAANRRIISLIVGAVWDEFGGIVSRTGDPGPAPGLRLAALEIFPERHPQPLGARGVALAAAGWPALLTRLSAGHALGIGRGGGFIKSKPDGSTSGH
jgi:hypothetical protein